MKEMCVKNLLVTGVAIFLLASIFFWTNGIFTHMNCCSQSWVDSAPDQLSRESRAQVRARSVAEVARMKREAFTYSLSSLAGALALGIICYMGFKRRARG